MGLRFIPSCMNHRPHLDFPEIEPTLMLSYPAPRDVFCVFFILIYYFIYFFLSLLSLSLCLVLLLAVFGCICRLHPPSSGFFHVGPLSLHHPLSAHGPGRACGGSHVQGTETDHTTSKTVVRGKGYEVQ